MKKKLWWRCPKCGHRIEFEDQLIRERGLFDLETGEENRLMRMSKGEASDSCISCDNCGRSWYLYVSDMIPPKKTIDAIRCEYKGAPECNEDMPQRIMTYEIREELKPFLREELVFSYYKCEFEQAEGEYCLCRTTCRPSSFWWIYQRSVCAKKTLEEKKLYLTYLEMQDPLILKSLCSFYQMEDCWILSQNDIPAFNLIDGKDMPHTTSWYQSSVLIPEILELELRIRGYQVEFFDAVEGYFFAIQDCPQDIFEVIQKRAECIIKGFHDSFTYLTEKESVDREFREVLKKRYHFKTYYLLESAEEELNEGSVQHEL